MTDADRDRVMAYTRTAAPMSKDDLWQAVETLSRLTGEATRRGLPDAFEILDTARAVALAMFCTPADEPEYSVRVWT